MTDEDKHCADLVRRGDKDRYLASLFAPESMRPHLLALYAFNVEITRIRDLVSEPHIGEIRLQWWQDTLDTIYHGDAQEHPVAMALARAIKQGDLPKHALKNLVTAHIFDFYSDPMPTLGDLEGYLGETSSSLIQMASLILAGSNGLENAEASGLAGVAYGMVGLLRSLPLHQRRAQCFLPLDILKARDLNPDDLTSADHQAAAGLVLSELRERARQRLAQARKMTFTISAAAQPAFLHVALTEPHLTLLARQGLNVLRQGAEISQWRKQWILWKAAKTESF
jgi:15-cis-phytoene synthase